MGVQCVREESEREACEVTSSVRLTTPGGNCLRMKLSGDMSRSRTSQLCWGERPRAQCWWRFTDPSVGVSSPLISLRSVDLPQPLGPT